jgi:hypothetical protein
VAFTHKGKGFDSLNNATGSDINSGQYGQADYASNLNEDTAKTLLSDNRFLQDLYDYYGERDGKSFNGQEDVIDYYLSDRRWRNLNTVSIGRDVYDANTSSDTQTKRLARIQQVYDALPFGVDGAGSAILEGGMAMLADPINLIGFGAGGQAARLAVGTAAKGLTKSQLITKGITAGITSGAKGEAVASGIAEGVADIGIQNRNVAVGLQEDVSYMRAGLAAGTGALTGGAMGAGMGLGGAIAPTGAIKGMAQKIPIVGRAFDDTSSAAAGKGITQLSDEGLAEVSRRAGTNVDRSSITRGMADRAANAAGRVDTTGGIASPTVAPRGDMADLEMDTSTTLEQSLKGAEEERATYQQEIEELRRNGEVDEATRLERIALQPLEEKITRIKNISSWPIVKAQTEAKISAEQARMAETGETKSPVLDKLSAYYERQQSDYNAFVLKARSEIESGGSLSADRIDDYFDQTPEQLPVEGLEGEGFTVKSSLPEQPELTSLNAPDAVQNPDTARTPQAPNLEEAASDTVEQVVDIAEAAAADEAVPLEQRIGDITNRLDGRRKGSIAYEGKRLDREMANLPEKLEDGTDNPEYLTLKNRREAIDKEAVALKEEQRTLEEQFGSQQKDAVDQINNTNPEQAPPVEEPSTDGSSITPEADDVAPVAEVDNEVVLNEYLDNEFSPTVRNIRKEFKDLGLRTDESETIIKSMPSGNSREAIQSRRTAVKETVNMVRGQRAWQRLLNLSGKGGVPDSMYDDDVASALIEASVPANLQPHAEQAFRSWRSRQATRYAVNLDTEMMGFATTDEMLDIARRRFGEGGFYQDIVNHFSALREGKILNSPDNGEVQAISDFVQQQVELMPPDLRLEWTAMKEATIKHMVRNGKLDRASAIKLVTATQDAILERFIQAQAYKSMDANGKFFDAKQSATRTTRPMDLNEEQILDGHGDHIGRIQRNLQNVTMGTGKAGSGKELGSRQIGSIQKMLQSLDPASGNEYHGGTFTKISTVRDGKLYIYDQAESSRRLNEEAMIERNKSMAGAQDPVVRQRSIDAAEEAKDSGQPSRKDPRDYEDAMSEMNKARNAVQRAQDNIAKIEAGSDDDFQKRMPKANEKLDAAQERMNEAMRVSRNLSELPATTDKETGRVTFADYEDILEKLRADYKPLVTSDKGTVVANRVETDRAKPIRRYFDVQARKSGAIKELRKAEAKQDAQKSLGLKKEIARLNKKLNEMLEGMSPRERQLIKGDDAKAAVKTLASIKRAARADYRDKQDIASNEQVPESEMLQEMEDVFNHTFTDEDQIRAEYYANQEDLANIAYQEQASKIEYLHENKGDMAPQEVRQSVMEIQAEAEQKIQATKPDTRPKGEPNPNIVQIGKRAYNMSKDVQYQTVSDNTHNFFVDGRNLGTIKKFEDGSYQVIRRNGESVVSVKASTRNEAMQLVAKSAKKELDQMLDGKGVAQEIAEAPSPVTIPDYHHTQRYDAVEDVPATTASEDPMANATEGRPVADVITQDQMSQGKTLALQVTDPKHKDYGTAKGTRVLNVNPLKGGKVQNSSSEITAGLRPDQYVMGDVDMMNPRGDNTRSGTVHARKSFRPLNPDDEFQSFGGNRLTGAQAGRTEPVIPDATANLPTSPRARANRPVHINELDNMPLNQDNATEALMSLMPEPIRTGNMDTVGKLARYIADVEDIEWSSFKSIEDYDFQVKSLQTMYDALAKFAPNGVKLPNQTRQKSYKNLSQQIAGMNAAEKGEILSIFNMISGSPNRQGSDAMPVFDKGDKTYGYHQPGRLAEDQNNQIVIGTSSQQPDALNFAHEMGHWAYQNMMTPAERMEFWTIARGYVGSDGADIAALKKRLPGISTEAEIRSPSEFFANQFAIYVANTRKGSTGSLLSRLFKDVGRKAEAVVRRILGLDDQLDPKMVELFDRIMPDPKIADGSVSAGRPIHNQFEHLLAKVNSDGSDAPIRLAAQQLNDLRGMQVELEEALRMGGAAGHDASILADILERTSRRIYGMYGGKPGEKTHRNRKDASGNIIEGGKRVTALDSYDSKGRPAYANKPEIRLPNGKTVKPFAYMDARIARGRMLSQSFKTMRTLQDERLVGALDNFDKSDMTEAARSAELQRLIETQEGGDILSVPDEAMAFMTPADFGTTSGTLESMFERDADIIQQMMGRKGADEVLEAYLVQQANDMIVALDGGLDEFVNMFNRNFNKTGSVAPNIDKTGRVYKAGNMKAKRYAKAVSKKNERLAKTLLESIMKAQDEVFGSAEVDVVDPVVNASPKTISTNELLEKIRAVGSNTPEVIEMKQEVYTRMQAGPYTKPFNELNDAELEALRSIKSVADARKVYDEAMVTGEWDKAQTAISYLANKTENPIKVKSSVVGRALDIETKQRSTVDAMNGVPGDAPATIKEVLGKITHRNKKVEYTSRTMLYRMLNLMGRTATDLVENNTTFMSVQDLYKLSGEVAPSGTKAAFAETARLNGAPFNSLRKQMRTFAIGINEGNADPVDMMHEIGHMISRSTFEDIDRDHMLQGFKEAMDKNDPAALKIKELYGKVDGYKDSDVAEEWFVESWGQWMAERVAKGDIFNVRYGDGGMADLSVKGYLSQLADRLYEFTAYVLNGMMGRKSMKQMYRQMTYHGDMFAKKRTSTPIKNAVNTYQYPTVSASLAPAYGKDIVKSLGREKELLLREFLGLDPDESVADYIMYHGTPVIDEFNRARNPDAYIRPSEDGMYGEGTYTTNNPQYAEGYADGTRMDAYRNVVEKLEGDKKADAEALISKMDEEQRFLEEESWKAGDDELGASRIANYTARLEATKEAFARLTGNKSMGGVIPMFVRTKKHYRFTSDTMFQYGTGDKSDISHMLASAQNGGYISGDSHRALAELIQQGDGMSGDVFYSRLSSEMTDPNARSIQTRTHEEDLMGRKKLSQFLKSEGYEGIIADVGFGEKLREVVTFNPNHMKHVNADVFDSDRRGMYYSVLGQPGTVGVGGEVLSSMAMKQRTIGVDDMVGVARKMQEAGVPDLVKPIRRMIRKEAPSAEDIDTVRKNSSVFSYFRENSQRLREMGASWMGDFIKPENGTGLYERHDVDLSDKVLPIYNALKSLPDNSGWAKRWARRSMSFLPNKFTGKANLESSPQSHQRILGAIRRGEMAVRELNNQEQGVARQIISAFESERERMLEAGLPVGDSRRSSGDFYVPQQWDIELMRSNPKKAKAAFAQYFFDESRKMDFEDVPLDPSAANRKSEEFINTLLDTDGETYGDDVLRRAVGDPFYNRVINLEPGQYDFMEEFLVNDLDGLIASYFDRTTRKVALTKQFGAAGHGFSSYITTATQGVDGAVKTLMSNKKVVYKYRQYQEEAPIEQLVVPALKDNHANIKQMLEEAKFMIQEDKSVEGARNLILSKFEAPDQADPNLRVRVDSIVNAMKDYPDGNMPESAKKLAENMTDIMNKRPLVKFSDAKASYLVSRNVKAFNSISLLAFTTLTSLGDVALPLVRSGNLGAFLKAQKQWYSVDPSYRAAAKNIGVGVENLMHDRMVQMAGEGSQKVQNSFFNFTLLTPWTNMQREIAGLVGFEAFKSEIAKARRLASAGKQGSKSFKASERFLKRYGMTGENASTDFLSFDAPVLNDIRDTDLMSNKQLRYALMRFTNEAIFTPNPNDIPTWAQTPWGSMFFQLKSFQLMMARMSKHVYNEAKQGNPYPAMYLATAGVGMGYASAGVKDIVQSRGGEDNESRELRKRKLTNSPLGTMAESMFGLEEGSDNDQIMGNYLEGMMAIGGLGLFGELLYNTAEQADNGKFGFVRTAGAIFGPAVGTAEDAYDVFVAGPMGAFDDKAARRREAVRSVVGRIPIAGGIRGFKEDVVDSIAGEAGSGNKKSASKLGFAEGSGFSGGGFGTEGF